MSQNPSKPPPYRTSSEINQTAGDNATQIGQVYGNVILNQFQRHPTLLYLVLFLAMVGLCVITWRVAPFIGVRNNFLNSIGETICGVTQPVSTSQAFQSLPSVVSSTPTIEPSCISTGTNGLGLRVRDGPGISYAVITKVPDGTNLKPVARNPDGDWIKVVAQESTILGWVDAGFVTSCNIDLTTLPVEGSTSISQPILTQEPVIIPVVPTTPDIGHIGTWAGLTQQNQPISFTVAEDPVGEAAFNLSISFVFDTPCPIGQASFSSLDNAHIFGGPSYHFSFLNLTASNARAILEGGFTSDTTATGTFTVNDSRNPSARQDQACPFTTTITWNATKQ